MAADVSIVVVNYRTPELSARALAAAAAAAPEIDVEEIVVDSASGDDSVDRLPSLRPDVRVVALEDNGGYGAALNAGAALATGRYVLLLNSDAFAHGDALSRLAHYLDDKPTAGIAAPALVNEDGSRQLSAYRRFPNAATVFLDYAHPFARPLYGTRWHPYVAGEDLYAGGPRAVAHAMGAALLVRADVLRATGGFDERFFMYLEETEWQHRVAAAGWQIHLVPDAVFTHVGGGSAGDYSFATPMFVQSLDRYFSGSRSVRAAAVAGSLVTLAGARIAGRARPGDPRFPPLADAARRALRELRS